MPSKKTDPKYTDPEIEKFVRENKEMIEKLLQQERANIKKVMEAESANAKDFAEFQEEKIEEILSKSKEPFEEFADCQKDKMEHAAQSVIVMFMDPEFQKHMVSAGMEMMMALEALVKAAPLPDFARDAAEKAQETRDNATKAYCQKNPDCVNKKASRQTQKVPIKGSAKVDKE